MYLSAQKNYSSTDIKGNFTFKIDKGTGVTKDTDEPESNVDTAPSVELSKAAKSIIEPKRKIKAEPKVEPNVGRAKRKK